LKKEKRSKNGRRLKRIDLLKASDTERADLITCAKERLRQKVAEAKMWQPFIELGHLTINGETICSDEIQLKGISVGDMSEDM
jgi:hypothetical protein